MTAYIEDILNLYVDSIAINDSNLQILSSISKQCKKGIALTDRQYNLVINKLLEYKDVLAEHNVDINNTLGPRLPLREIDRRKLIEIVDTASVFSNTPYESYKEKWLWLKVRFPFSKKDIVAVESIVRNTKDYFHRKGSHEHYFKLTALNAYYVYKELHNRNFTVDQDVVDLHNKVQKIIEEDSLYKPVLNNGNLINVNEDVVKDITDTDIVFLQDKAIRYGYEIQHPVTDNTLASEISVRQEPEMLLPPTKYNLNQIANSFLELDRFPLIVLIDEAHAFSQIVQIYSAFNGFVPNEEQSVLFRVDSNDNTNCELNAFIQQKQLNNWVDKNTKIVYIKKNKIPKVLLKSDFVPTTALSIKSDRFNSQINDWVKFNCDLIVYNDNTFSNFKNWTKW